MRWWRSARRRRPNLDATYREAYCETVKNVTVSLDDETYRRARLQAAERGRSLSSLVRDFLQDLGSGETRVERRRRALRDLFARMDAKGVGMDASKIMSRDEVYSERFRR